MKQRTFIRTIICEREENITSISLRRLFEFSCNLAGYCYSRHSIRFVFYSHNNRCRGVLLCLWVCLCSYLWNRSERDDRSHTICFILFCVFDSVYRCFVEYFCVCDISYIKCRLGDVYYQYLICTSVLFQRYFWGIFRTFHFVFIEGKQRFIYINSNPTTKHLLNHQIRVITVNLHWIKSNPSNFGRNIFIHQEVNDIKHVLWRLKIYKVQSQIEI